ncbi:MAG: putative ATP-grasp-modified RiPP, partial [Gammaproteobacteria bacterium]
DMAPIFPGSDHFPLGRSCGVVPAAAEPPSAVRPFGLTLTVSPRTTALVDLTTFVYDEVAQIGVVREGADMIPLSRHTTGKTNTVTDGGDGQNTNKDSDSDYRED